ncbi:aldolase [Nocardia implantans]|uniref:Aldolase n=1 Tax=Nocardia implantans TaxID=3108168 RepID=A0ABU6B4I3_9NOCA|nr:MULTISPECIES: aldolase [unclassified Nocardia]MEA3532821.1 aldolase [Nocardia sp. CDC192]MEB3514693.1 aldolase [Nocardia sp. CDC186]
MTSTEPRDLTTAIRPQLADQLSGLAWSARELTALTCRILAAEQHCFALAGQVTSRADNGSFWTVPWSPAFDAMTVNDVIRVDDDLNTLEGSAQPNPATRFHYWVYRARPDVNCIIHTHPPYISALSMIGRPLVISHMDATPLYQDVAFLPDWPGVPVADHEGELISEGLGDKRAILLAHHGMLTTGRTIEEATVLALMLEHAAKMQVRAEAIGEIRPIPEHLALEAKDFLLQPSVIQATYRSFADRVLRTDPDTLRAS